MTLRTRLALLAAITAVAAVSLAGCAPGSNSGDGGDTALGAITGITFSQHQAVPDFDDAEYTQDDAAELTKFQALLDQYKVDPATYQSPDTAGCAGGLSADVNIDYLASGVDTPIKTQLTINSCGLSDGFEVDANTLLTQWRADLSGVK